jgi:hypothetical protein
MVTAEFRLWQYNLTVAKAGSGAGTVTSSPAGILGHGGHRRLPAAVTSPALGML